jgi:hypothetical protein
VVARVALAQVVEDELPTLRPEALLQACEEHRAPRLVAAALPEELALERVDGVDVVGVHGRARLFTARSCALMPVT